MKTLLTLFLFFICAVSYAQVIPSETGPNPAKKPVKKTKQVKKVSQPVIASTETVKIFPDSDCTVYVDGEMRGKVTAGNNLKIALAKGTYRIRAVGTNPADIFIQDYTVENLGTETILAINLKPIIDSRKEKLRALGSGPYKYITGKWIGHPQFSDGRLMDQINTYNFIVNDDELTGYQVGYNKQIPIVKGEITGNSFTFTTYPRDDVIVKHSGKFYADSIGIDFEVNGGHAIHTTLKKAN